MEATVPTEGEAPEFVLLCYTWGLVVNCQEQNDTAGTTTTTAVAEISGREAANDVDLSRLLVFWFGFFVTSDLFFFVNRQVQRFIADSISWRSGKRWREGWGTDMMSSAYCMLFFPW